MKIDHQLKQASSRRALVWLVVGVVGVIGWWMGKDVTGLITLGAGIAGGIGIMQDP